MEGASATLLKEARERAGLSRRTLAERAGVALTTVSRIESGESDPTVGMLKRLLQAAGARMTINVEPDRESAPTIAALASAIDPDTNPDKVDWTRLRGFADFVFQHPEKVEVMLDTPPKLTHTFLDQVLAGMAETIADDTDTPRPKWTRNVGALREQWAQLGTPRMAAAAREATPEPFARRNMVLAREAIFRAR